MSKAPPLPYAVLHGCYTRRPCFRRAAKPRGRIDRGVGPGVPLLPPPGADPASFVCRGARRSTRSIMMRAHRLHRPGHFRRTTPESNRHAGAPPLAAGPWRALSQDHRTQLRVRRAGLNRIPLLTEAFADLETPLSLTLKLAYADGGGKRLLLESVVGEATLGRLPSSVCRRTLPARQRFMTDVVRRVVVRDARRQSAGLHRPCVPRRALKVALQARPPPRYCGGRRATLCHDAMLHRSSLTDLEDRRHRRIARTSCCAARCSELAAAGLDNSQGACVPDRHHASTC